MIDLVFINKDPQPYIDQLNKFYGIPEEGQNGKYANDGERIDGQGKTYNFFQPKYHPTDPTKWRMPKFEGIPQNILDDNLIYGYEMERTEENLINGGWKSNIP